jgi:hypothetical protein
VTSIFSASQLPETKKLSSNNRDESQLFSRGTTLVPGFTGTSVEYSRLVFRLRIPGDEKQTETLEGEMANIRIPENGG